LNWRKMSGHSIDPTCRWVMFLIVSSSVGEMSNGFSLFVSLEYSSSVTAQMEISPILYHLPSRVMTTSVVLGIIMALYQKILLTMDWIENTTKRRMATIARKNENTINSAIEFLNDSDVELEE
jgi:hypothetical protein